MISNLLQATRFIDSDNPHIIEFAQQTTAHCSSDSEKAVALYYAVRDQIRYDPKNIDLNPDHIKASITLLRGSGYCIEKSLVLAAAARALNIPARLGFANVRNHLATDKFIAALRTDVFVYHGYVSLFTAGKWTKATPAFNLSLCEKFGVAPLEYDAQSDSIFQEYDAKGERKYMEYLQYHGEFDDFPFDNFVQELRIHYPHFF
jgi:transglutaminase-like putative cysteine protease